MRNRKSFAAVSAIILALLLVLSGCKQNGGTSDVTTGGEGNSNSAMTGMSAGITDAPTTQKPKYSPNDKLIALTFDDGPRGATTNRILDVLEQNNGVATFFVVGYNIENNASTIKRASELGCEIGNHSKDHKTLTKCSYDVLREQVDAPNSTLKSITGKSPVLFRAPGGAYKGVTEDIGMPLIQWSIDTNDWRFKDAAHKGRSEEQRSADMKKICDNVLESAQGGDIVLMHDIYDFTADLCEMVIPGLVQKGFKLVTVSELFEAYGEKLNNGEVYFNARIQDVAATVGNTAPVDSGTYKVSTSGSVLNVRALPETSAEVLIKIPNGSTVTVSKSVPGWAYVSYESVNGWVNAAYIVKE